MGIDIKLSPDLSLYALNAQLGNILFVSSLAPVANDSQTRTQALGRIDRPFRTIQNAVSIATNNDCIFVLNGTFNENIIISTSKFLTFYLFDCTIIGQWDLGTNTHIIGVSPYKTTLQFTTGLHFIVRTGLVNTIENCRIISTGQTTFGRVSNESGFINLVNCNVTCGRFMGSGLYNSIIKNSQIIAQLTSALHLYVNIPTYIINSYIEAQTNVFSTEGGVIRTVNVINSTLYAKNGFSLTAQSSVGFGTLVVDNSKLISDTTNAININNNTLLDLTRVKIKCVGNSTNISASATSQYIDVVSTGSLPTTGITANIHPSLSITLDPLKYRLFP